MNTFSQSIYVRVLGFVLAVCLAQTVISQDELSSAVAEASQPATTVIAAYRPMLSATSLNTRRCDALDAFGNPQRPCRS